MKILKKTIAIIFSSISILNCSVKAGYLESCFGYIKNEIENYSVEKDPFFEEVDGLNSLIFNVRRNLMQIYTEKNIDIDVDQIDCILAPIFINYALNLSFSDKYYSCQFVNFSHRYSDFYDRKYVVFGDVWINNANEDEVIKNLKNLLMYYNKGAVGSFFEFDQAPFLPDDRSNQLKFIKLLNKIVEKLLKSNTIIEGSTNENANKNIEKRLDSRENLYGHKRLQFNDLKISCPIPRYTTPTLKDPLTSSDASLDEEFMFFGMPMYYEESEGSLCVSPPYDKPADEDIINAEIIEKFWLKILESKDNDE